MAKAAVQTYKAGAKFIRISPYKVREVAAIIKGKHVDEARRILAFTPKAASIEMSKILESAIANAEHNFQVPQEELYVRFVSADEGVTIKRFRPRAQGRGFRIRKRTSHIQLELERRVGEVVEKPRRATRGATKPATPKGGTKADATDKGSAQSKGGAKPKPDSKGKSADEKPGAAKAKATPSEKKAAEGRSTSKPAAGAKATAKPEPAKSSTKTKKEGN
jgi:large subunit ribosomal protein L22